MHTKLQLSPLKQRSRRFSSSQKLGARWNGIIIFAFVLATSIGLGQRVAATGAPAAVTLPAAGTNTTCVLSATITPNGFPTVAWFEWGTTSGFGHRTTPVAVGNGSTAFSLNTSLSDLTSGVAYHYRIVATNAGGISVGQDNIFQSPLVILNGPSVVTNWYGTQFVNPGVSVKAGLMAIAAGGAHSLALKADGTVVGWGFSANGEINIPPSATNVIAIAAGEGHSVALRADGSVIAWGGSSSGRTNVPDSATNVVAITAGEFYSLGLKTDGSVIGWGWSFYGQTNVPESATNIIGIAGGIYRSLALRSDGTLMSWGRDVYGEGIIPSDATNMMAIASGWYHSLVLKTDGSVMAWGAGTNNAGSAPDFGQSSVPGTATGVVAISSSLNHNLALKSDGSVVGWGFNNYGQAAPPSVTNAVAVAAGYYHSLAILADGSVVGWGSDVNGETTIPAGLSDVNLPVTVIGSSLAPGKYLLNYVATNVRGEVGTATRLVTVPEAQQIKADVLGEMMDTNETANIRQLDRVTNDLARSLLPSLWVDQSHLDPKVGDKVFIDEARAVLGLRRLIHQRQKAIPNSVLQGWINRLVLADQILANTKIQEAELLNPNSKAIAGARKKYDAGDRAGTQQRYVQAILNYGVAWRRASHVAANAL
jgi:alpha-tubulin suppressor-like RCC1 family protein